MPQRVQINRPGEDHERPQLIEQDSRCPLDAVGASCSQSPKEGTTCQHSICASAYQLRDVTAPLDTTIRQAQNLAYHCRAHAIARLHYQLQIADTTVTKRLDEIIETRSSLEAVPVEKIREGLAERKKVNRIGEPADVAALVSFLCRPEARHIQGVAIAVDGGGTRGLY